MRTSFATGRLQIVIRGLPPMIVDARADAFP